MARARFLMQAVKGLTHAENINGMLTTSGLKSALLSVGFVTAAGVSVISSNASKVKPKTTAYIGIRNDITSIQGVLALMDCVSEVYAVDTGTRSRIFHPKIYMCLTATTGMATVGSANLTHGGLYNNIEGSALLDLVRGDADDKAFIDEALTTFEDLKAAHPEHVFRITSASDAQKLFEQGRLVDEREVSPPSTRSRVAKGATRDTLLPIDLPFVSGKVAKGGPASASAKSAKAGQKTSSSTKKIADPGEGYRLIWESEGLSERDLNVPTKSTTNPAGSMTLKRGSRDIDHMVWFRENAFSGLAWTRQKTREHIETATAQFGLVVKGLNYGVHELTIRHDTRTDSPTFRKRIPVTHLSWGSAKAIVANRDLLGRRMSLYRKEGNPPEFMIEID